MKPKTIPQAPGYLIYPDGRIFSEKTNKFLSQWRTCGRNRDNFYMRTKISFNNKSINIAIHRLVAMAFLGPQKSNMTVNHKDGNRLNNHISNLEYLTASENVLHAIETGNHPAKFRDVIFLDPQGNKFHVKNVSKFCRENNLQQGNISKVLSEERTHHKNWRAYYA